jgi:hypothetical protein
MSKAYDLRLYLATGLNVHSGVTWQGYDLRQVCDLYTRHVTTPTCMRRSSMSKPRKAQLSALVQQACVRNSSDCDLSRVT